MIFSLTFSFCLLFVQNLTASITIQNGTHLTTINSLIDEAANNYFKPLEEYRKQEAQKARLAHFSNNKQTQTVVQPKVVQPAIEQLTNHYNKQKEIKIQCTAFCDYVLKNNKESESIENVLKKSLTHFWQPSFIECYLNVKKSFNKSKYKIKEMEESFKTITLNDDSSNQRIRKVIEDSIASLKMNLQIAYNEKVVTLHNYIQKNNLDVFLLTNLSPLYEKFYKEICQNFFQETLKQTLDLNSPMREDAFFQKILNKFKKKFFSNARDFFSENVESNIDTFKLFFESIVAHQTLFNGCSDYIISLTNQKYPQNIRAGVTKHILDEALRLYRSWLNDSSDHDNQAILTNIQQSAMTEISSFYKATIADKIKANYPEMNHGTRDYWATLFQTALFSGIEFQDYPELDKTFEQAFEEFDLNNPSYNSSLNTNQTLCQNINQLVLNTHTRVHQNIEITRLDRILKYLKKKYYARKFLITCLIPIIGFFVILKALKKIGGFY